MGKWALTMEGTLATIMDTLHCSDIATALSIITVITRDQATVSQPKENFEIKRKTSSVLCDQVTKFEDNNTRLLRANVELKLDATDKEK